MAFKRSSASNGFVRNSTAPAFMAFTDIGILPCPVRKMIGTAIPASASSRCRSSPLKPGSSTSRITHDRGAPAARFINRCAEANSSTSNPSIRRRLPALPARRHHHQLHKQADQSFSLFICSFSSFSVNENLTSVCFASQVSSILFRGAAAVVQSRLNRGKKGLFAKRLEKTSHRAIDHHPGEHRLISHGP